MGVYRGVTQDNVTINGGTLYSVSLAGDVKIPSATVAATGTNQATAAAIASGFTLVSAADATKGVKLPAAAAGLVVIVKNGAAATLELYPNTSDKINGGSANAALTMAASTSAVLVAYDDVDWYSVPLLPS